MWVLVVLGCKRAFNEKATHMGQEVEERGELSQVAEGKVFPEGSIGSDTQDSKCMQTSDTRGTCLIGRGSWWCPPGWLRTCRNQSREHPSLSQPGRKQEFNLFLPLLLHHMQHCIREFTSMFSIWKNYYKWAGHRRFLWQWNYPVWYYHGGYMSFCSCSIPQNQVWVQR